jgi:hypothetical protein
MGWGGSARRDTDAVPHEVSAGTTLEHGIACRVASDSRVTIP